MNFLLVRLYSGQGHLFGVECCFKSRLFSPSDHFTSRTHCELGIIKRTFLNLILMNSIKMFTVTLTQVSNPKDYCLQ